MSRTRPPSAAPAPTAPIAGATRWPAAWLGIGVGAIGVAAWFAAAFADPATPIARYLLILLAAAGPLGLLVGSVWWLMRQRSAAGRESQRRQASTASVLQLLDLLPLPIALCGADRDRAAINRAMAELFGIERSASIEMPWDWRTHIVDSDRAAWSGALASTRLAGRTQWLEVRMRLAGGAREVLALLAPTDIDGGDGIAVVLRIAEDAVAQKTLLELRELLETAEAEKWRFGQAVHDELGQRLSGLAYFAKGLARRLKAAQRPEADDATWMTELANESMAVARDLARGLVPVGSDDPQAFVSALRLLADNTAKMFDAQCTLHVDPQFDPGGSARANHLYHAIQELTTNAMKHGGARRVDLRLEVSPRGQRISVRNDGAAMLIGAWPARPGMGLNGVRSRVGHLGGRFAIGNEAGEGVLASIELPFAPPPEAPAGDGGRAPAPEQP